MASDTPTARPGKLNLTALPPGRFLYTINGSGGIYEGRILDRQMDPDGAGQYLKLDESGQWHWSNDVWLEHLLDEPKTATPPPPVKVLPSAKPKGKPLTPDS